MLVIIPDWYKNQIGEFLRLAWDFVGGAGGVCPVLVAVAQQVAIADVDLLQPGIQRSLTGGFRMVC